MSIVSLPGRSVAGHARRCPPRPGPAGCRPAAGHRVAGSPQYRRAPAGALYAPAMGLASTLGRRERAAAPLAAWRPVRSVPLRLWAALAAGLLLAAGVALGLAYARSLEQRALRGLAPLAFQQK